MYRDKVVGVDLTQRATQTGGRVWWRCHTELTATIYGQHVGGFLEVADIMARRLLHSVLTAGGYGGVVIQN